MHPIPQRALFQLNPILPDAMLQGRRFPESYRACARSFRVFEDWRYDLLSVRRHPVMSVIGESLYAPFNGR